MLMAHHFEVPVQKMFPKYLARVQPGEILGDLRETPFSFLLILDLPQVRIGESGFLNPFGLYCGKGVSENKTYV